MPYRVIMPGLPPVVDPMYSMYDTLEKAITNLFLSDLKPDEGIGWSEYLSGGNWLGTYLERFFPKTSKTGWNCLKDNHIFRRPEMILQYYTVINQNIKVNRDDKQAQYVKLTEVLGKW